jgi:hypothetical protein
MSLSHATRSRAHAADVRQREQFSVAFQLLDLLTGAAALERGYNVLAFDGPAQGPRCSSTTCGCGPTGRSSSAPCSTPRSTTPLEYLDTLREFTLRDRAERINCPTWVCNAENDDIGASAPELVAHLQCEHEFVQFKASDGAGDHCEAGARVLYHATSFDWLDAILQPRATHPARDQFDRSAGSATVMVVPTLSVESTTIVPPLWETMP